MKWTKHSQNLQAINNNLPVSFWVSHCSEGGFNAVVYCGGKLIFSAPAFDHEQGKAICEEWLEGFINQLENLRRES